MTISELIAQLEAIKAEHGDLPVEVERQGCHSAPECKFQEDGRGDKFVEL